MNETETGMTIVASSAPPPAPRRMSLSQILAERLNIDPQTMIQTIKAQCFRGIPPEKISNEQLISFCSVANALKLNPLLPGMLYAYPTKEGGIMPMIGPDGVFQALSSNPDVDVWWTEVTREENGTLISATAHIKLKSKSAPLNKTVYLTEWRMQSNPNWSSRPTHMLELRALKQCARQVIHGLPYDEDEAAGLLPPTTAVEIIETEQGTAARARQRLAGQAPAASPPPPLPPPTEAPRRPGRPAGSKNKPKEPASIETEGPSGGVVFRFRRPLRYQDLDEFKEQFDRIWSDEMDAIVLKEGREATDADEEKATAITLKKLDAQFVEAGLLAPES